MRLTKFSDYALRALLIAASRPGEYVTIEETAETFGISHAHLKKVVSLLIRENYLRGTRGRSGGFMLNMPPEQINLGQLLRLTEPDFGMVECFRSDNACLITCQCRLPNVINKALTAFIEIFNEYTLKDILVDARFFLDDPNAPPVPRLPQRGPHIPQ